MTPAQTGETGPLRCLLVGAEPGVRSSVERWAEEGGAILATAPDAGAAVRRFGESPFDVVLAILGENAEDDVSLWEATLQEAGREPQVLLAAEHPTLSLAVRAAALGTAELVARPPRPEDFQRSLERARARRRNGAVVLHSVQGYRLGQRMLIGESPAMLEVYRTVASVAPTRATVLVQGESGTGKELVARAIHENGPRRRGPFVAVNSAAIPEGLLESELFGHEKGAFTGAVERTAGKFLQAEGGTLFLDEVADMSLSLQAKVLRAIEERAIERVGNGPSIPVDARVVAATNRDLRREIEAGKFREDLYHRLAVVTVHLPPLRERREDLELLSIHLAHQAASQHGKVVTGISREALAILRAHAWPGNVRELRNAVERAVIVARGSTITAEDLAEDLRRRGDFVEPAEDAGPLTLEEAEARHIAAVLSGTGGRLDTAAKILGIHRNTLARKVRKYGL